MLIDTRPVSCQSVVVVWDHLVTRKTYVDSRSPKYDDVHNYLLSASLWNGNLSGSMAQGGKEMTAGQEQDDGDARDGGYSTHS